MLYRSPPARVGPGLPVGADGAGIARPPNGAAIWGTQEWVEFAHGSSPRHEEELRSPRLALSASPGAVGSDEGLHAQMDLRHVLPAIRVPTLLLTARPRATSRLEQARYVADRIPGAARHELPNGDHIPTSRPPTTSPGDAVVRRGSLGSPGWEQEPETIALATVLFTDIVGSTGERPSSATEAGTSCSSGTTACPAGARPLPRA